MTLSAVLFVSEVATLVIKKLTVRLCALVLVFVTFIHISHDILKKNVRYRFESVVVIVFVAIMMKILFLFLLSIYTDYLFQEFGLNEVNAYM